MANGLVSIELFLQCLGMQLEILHYDVGRRCVYSLNIKENYGQIDLLGTLMWRPEKY